MDGLNFVKFVLETEGKQALSVVSKTTVAKFFAPLLGLPLVTADVERPKPSQASSPKIAAVRRHQSDTESSSSSSSRDQSSTERESDNESGNEHKELVADLRRALQFERNQIQEMRKFYEERIAQQTTDLETACLQVDLFSSQHAGNYNYEALAQYLARRYRAQPSLPILQEELIEAVQGFNQLAQSEDQEHLKIDVDQAQLRTALQRLAKSQESDIAVPPHVRKEIQDLKEDSDEWGMI